ncbi:hypothetical protein O6H91_10G029800 [Diphasiastrum complanatum]|uniref:Uncharacterized protein n=2 Tax=Diphasiastrum complanatum TaxID=34168 RepID=A0ACC2CFK0_DIPCM|nr:hypothetical protein O6H91_Y570900 [Diphasiastrum complanatum]KAJ7110302.1 hypothetical protein O6H91_Y570900 [Diphasiastrum complanatum]KAJ7540768.1 hypothetical protein O6H91_10G029800 [Diphasiastrum complanatum]KAJ7540769.1 hypothetical protein O6H91_10G029800 [Diphasiastrum complanatum]
MPSAMENFNSHRIVLAALTLMSYVLRTDAAVAMIVFGDSLVDTGNNNYINSIAKANFLPNGVDFPTRNPTGRFCNGLIISDFLSEYMGTEPILPVLDPNAKGKNLLRGVNFASAGAGILDDTGAIFLQRLIFPQQIQLFQKYQRDVADLIGPVATARLISEALYSVTMGGNDYINNYLLPLSVRKRQYTPDQFNQLLIATFRNQLTQIYNLGARKITVSNIGPLGCIPSQLSMATVSTKCIPELNEYASSFNAALKLMLEELNRNLPGAMFVYSNGYDIIFDYIRNPAAYGFQASTKACCGQGSYNGALVCTALSNLCTDRSKYVFWDPFHPTEAINRLVTERILNGPPSDISPINVKQLLAL